MEALTSQEEIRGRQAEISARLQELDNEFVGRTFPQNVRDEWNALNEERDEIAATLKELEARAARIAELASDPASREDGPAPFQTHRPTSVRGDDIYDLSTVRSSFAEPELAFRELRDRAMRSVEKAHFAHGGCRREDAQGHIERLLDTVDGQVEGFGSDNQLGSLARRILTTGSPTYKRAFGKYIAGRGITSEEQRALALGSGATGGFAVVYTLDPTVVPTSNFSVNPFRAVARVETLTGTNEWKALTSGAITAAYSAEATQSSDNAPTLAQPDIIVEKAQAFVPFSIELGQDWTMLQSEMAQLLQDAKDDLEATKFALGAGHGSNEPKGIITAATSTTTAGGAAAFAIADLYKVFEALPPRFRVRAQWMGNLFTIDKIRQFDTAGGSGVWYDNFGTGANTRGLGPAVDSLASGTLSSGNASGTLFGRNFWESTAMASVLTTGSKILIVGDWRYFVIVDRVGMNVEFIQNLVGANQRPTGQRGLYAYWRNSSDVLGATAFQVLVTG